MKGIRDTEGKKEAEVATGKEEARKDGTGKEAKERAGGSHGRAGGSLGRVVKGIRDMEGGRSRRKE